jgi:hypothetical protein
VRARSRSRGFPAPFAAAADARRGQALGQGDEADAKAVGRRSVSVALVTAIVLGLVMVPMVDLVAAALTTDDATAVVLAPLLLSIAVAQPMLQTHFTLAGVFRGAGDNWTPLVSAAIGNWGVRVPLALLCAYVLKTGVNWVWAVLVLDHVARVMAAHLISQRPLAAKAADDARRALSGVKPDDVETISCSKFSRMISRFSAAERSPSSSSNSRGEARPRGVGNRSPPARALRRSSAPAPARRPRRTGHHTCLRNSSLGVPGGAPKRHMSLL